MRGAGLVALAIAGMIAGSASAATLTHDYEFDGSGVVDSVGGADGVLHGGAIVSGGYLHLDGSDDYVSLAAIFPSASTSFSVFFSFTGHTTQAQTYTEVISQDGGSFYIGSENTAIRLTDAYYNTGVPFPVDGNAHGFLLTNTPTQSKLYIDGNLVFTGGPVASSPTASSEARFGRQYGGNLEYFRGDIDAIRVFSDVATYAEASASPAPEPASWAMMLGGFGLMGAALRRTRRAPVAA